MICYTERQESISDPMNFPNNVMKKKNSLLIMNSKRNIATYVHTHQGTLQASTYRPCSQDTKMDNLMLFYRGRDFIPTSVTSWRSLGTYLSSILGHNSWNDCILKVWSSRLLICLWLLGNNAVNYDWLAIYFVSGLHTVYHLSFTKAQKLALFPLFHRKAKI